VVAQAVSKASLVPFASCTDLAARMRREALREVTPYGLPYGGPVVAGIAFATSGPAPAMAAPLAEGDTAGGTAFSPTNVQEPGVDEADAVKTDGRLLVAVRATLPGVQVVDLTGAEPRLRGVLRLPADQYGPRLLLVGGRLVVVTDVQARQGDAFTQATKVQVVSLADPGHPRVERAFTLDGSLVAARALAGRVLLVTQDAPAITWAMPTGPGARATRVALAENRLRVRHAPLRAWLPSVVSSRGGSFPPSCSAALRPQTESGTATTSVVSLDPASDVPAGQAVVEGSGAVVYASTRSLYVTTSPWQAQPWAAVPSVPTEVTTSIHRFDLSDPSAPRYAGSGAVPGTLVGQYAMSEHAGVLRVASTVGQSWAAGEGPAVPPSDNVVTVLRPTGDRLAPVGRVRGLGRGERIYGVRFVGDLGYVVTFRQTDPLYVLDLSDPRRPRVTGALHVTGFSSYLQPLSDGLLLGIGQEVDQGRAQGTQLSTFDVTDGARPTLRSREVYPGAWSGAQDDPHQVLWWPSRRLLVVPLQQPSGPGTADQGGFDGAVALRVDATGGLHEVRRLQQPQGAPAAAGAPQMCCWGGILRSVVVGDELLTLSEGGVLATSLDSWEERAWLPYR
jgi:uncharacterized secreted protein with C-terminal beta-propeller domain